MMRYRDGHIIKALT